MSEMGCRSLLGSGLSEGPDPPEQGVRQSIIGCSLFFFWLSKLILKLSLLQVLSVYLPEQGLPSYAKTLKYSIERL